MVSPHDMEAILAKAEATATDQLIEAARAWVAANCYNPETIHNVIPSLPADVIVTAVQLAHPGGWAGFCHCQALCN